VSDRTDGVINTAWRGGWDQALSAPGGAEELRDLIYMQVANILQQEIHSDGPLPGERLPTETA
jgi:hypothetical protein